MDDEQLGRELGCDPSDLPRLGLCRRPDRTPPRFRADVERVAQRFGLSATALAKIVREVDATGAIRAADDLDVGALLAARDREPGPEAGPAPEESGASLPASGASAVAEEVDGVSDTSRADDRGAPSPDALTDRPTPETTE